MRKRMGEKGKCILAIALTAVMTITSLVGVPAKDMNTVKAATTLKNPSANGSGVVTWDCVYFGRYPQSDATGAVKEAVKWRVLSVSGNDAFLVADCNLDAQWFHNKFEAVTWENSIMRSWLNGYGNSTNLAGMDYSNTNFIDRAFYDVEQEAILATTVVNSVGNNTTDKIFLLSYDEVITPAYGFAADYTAKDPARIRLNTAYVGAGGSSGSKETKAAGQASFWRLRTMAGDYNKSTMNISLEGDVNTTGVNVEYAKYGVCPALHLDLSKTDIWSYAGTVSSDGTVTAGEAPPVVEETQEPEEDPETGATFAPVESSSGEKTVEFVAPKDGATEVVVPDYVTISGVRYEVASIADNAFKNNKKITKIEISDNVKSIGRNAFNGCTKLKTVSIGNKSQLTTIGDKAFYNCKKLTKITIPSKVDKIGKQAFCKCKSLKSITIKTAKLTTKNVGSKAFKSIHSKATIKVPKKKLSSYKKLLKKRGVSSKAKIKK